MCGITGTYNFHRSHLQTLYTRKCLYTMKHRGPDAQDVWDNSENYIAGFVRLAIRDVSSKGNQPMLSDDNNYCISFNGEIYNTDKLIQQLKPYRNEYYSSSDTEVLLYALIHLGIKQTLEVADGMFAFAFFDVQQNRLILARDRIGIKPLYIGTSAAGVVYSSQYDHIINHPFIKREPLDEEVIATYLSIGYMPENKGVVNHTFMLPHGTYAVVEKEKLSVHTYYSYSAGQEVSSAYSEKIIEQCVQSQLISDVPLGTFMSGGVDSTLVTCFANRHSSLRSFTIGMPDATLDESAAAAAFARILHTEHVCKYITQQDALHLLQVNAGAFSEPFADYSSLPTLLLSQFAKQHVTVTLSGDGGDELFWGYPRNRKAFNYLSFYRKNKLRRRASLLLGKLNKPLITDIGRHWNQQNFIDYYYTSFFITGASHWLPKIYKAQPLQPYFLCASQKLYNNDLDDMTCMNIARKMELDIHLQRILLKVDRASMYNSLEVRVPLLSNDMLYYSQAFTYKDCTRKEQGKIILKDILAKHTNEALVMQPKKGFVIPMDNWLRNDLKKEIEEKILDMPAALSAAFNRKALADMLRVHQNSRQNLGWFIWAVYSLVKWHETHVNKSALVA